MFFMEKHGENDGKMMKHGIAIIVYWFLREENGRYITFKSEKNIWTSREKLKQIGIESEMKRSPEKCFVPPAGRKVLPARHVDGLLYMTNPSQADLRAKT